MTKKAYTNAAEWFAEQSFYPVAEAQAEAERQRRARCRANVFHVFDKEIAEIDRRIAEAQAAIAGGVK